MKNNPTITLAAFSPRAFIAFTFCSAGAALAVLSLTPSTAQTAPTSSPQPYSRPGVTVMMLAANAGSTKSSSPVAVSGDGRYVAFSGGFPLGCCVVGVYDRQTGLTDTPAGSTGNSTLALSADGHYLAYSKPVYSSQDVFVLDRQTGTDTAISVAPDGSPPSCSSPGCVFSSWYPSISADGRYVSFASFATNLIAGDTQSSNNADVFVHDMQTGVTERVSVASDGTESNGLSYENAISADGRYVAFRSYGTNLVTGNTNSGSSATCALQGQTSRTSDVYVHDRQTGTTELVSVGMNGSQDGCSWSPSISGDGRYVAFVSSATNLIPSDSNGAWDVYVRDRQSGRTERVSVTPDGAQGTCAPSSCRCGAPSISADGRYVVFHTFQSLVSDDANQTGDIYIHDRETGSTERVSLAYPGEQVPGEPPGNANSTSGPNAANAPGISTDGRIIVFDSFAADLIQTDSWNNPNKTYTDVFFRDRGNAAGIGALTGTCSANPPTATGWATFSGGLLASADDPADDGVPPATEIGAELTGASIAYRPEKADLFVRLPVTALLPNTGAAPGVLYGFKITVGGIPYELRATKTEGFALYNCQMSPTCTQVVTLSGSMGTAGSVITASISLGALGASEGDTLSGLDGYTSLGTAAAGPSTVLDDVALASTAIPVHAVLLGIAPSTTPESQVVINTPTTLSNGNFSGNLPLVLAGSYKVWAKACLDNVCGSAVSAPLNVTDACAALPVQLNAVVSRKSHGSIAPPFDLVLNPDTPATIEPRAGGVVSGDQTLVFQFANTLGTVASITATATSGNGTQNVTANGNVGTDAHEYIVNLTGVPNASHLNVTLNGIIDSANHIGTVSAHMDVLFGDVNQTGRTDSGDVTVVRNNTVSIPDQTTYLFDVNTSGRVDAGDVTATRNATVTVLP